MGILKKQFEKMSKRTKLWINIWKILKLNQCFKHIFTHVWSLLRWGPIKRNLKKVDLSRIKTWNRWKRKSVRVQSCWTNTSVAAGGDKFTDVRIRSLGSVHVGWLFVLIVTGWCSAAGGSCVVFVALGDFRLCQWILLSAAFRSCLLPHTHGRRRPCVSWWDKLWVDLLLQRRLTANLWLVKLNYMEQEIKDTRIFSPDYKK